MPDRWRCASACRSAGSCWSKGWSEPMSRLAGRQFLNIPGPTNIPDRVLQAMHRPALDFQAPEFIEVQQECLENLKKVMKTDAEVMIYVYSGHGAWEAAVTNICSPGDTVLMCERSDDRRVGKGGVRTGRSRGEAEH